MRYVLGLLLSLALAGTVSAQQVAVRDFATVNMRGTKPSTEEKTRAEQEAKRKAWNKYQANAPESRQNVYMSNAAVFLEQLDTLCNITFYDPVVDAAAKTYTIKINLACNENQISALVTRLGGGGAGAQPMSASGEKPQISLAFFVRRSAGRKQFIDKKISSSSATVETTGSDISGDVSDDSGSTSMVASSDGASVTQRQTTETKGTVESRDDEFTYKFDPADGVTASVNNVLTTKGFEPVEYGEIAGSCEGPTTEEVIEGTSGVGNIPDQIRNRMRNAAKACEVGYFGIGILQVEKEEKMLDGNTRVGVTLILQVDKAPAAGSSRKFFSKVAAINIPSSQIGRNRENATNLALIDAAQRGVKELTEILINNRVN